MGALGDTGGGGPAPLTAVRRRRSGALVFIGFMGSGKSLAARSAAAALGLEALDSDRLLEAELGHTIPVEFELRGQASFRAAEEKLVCELLARAGAESVIALGGGAVLSTRVQAALADHVVVLLDVGVEDAWGRVSAPGADPRPLVRDHASFAALHRERLPLYEHLADAYVPAAERVQAALEHLGRLHDAPPGSRMIWAASASGQYPVWVGAGLLDDPPWPIADRASRRFCVTDTTVGALYGARVAPVEMCFEIPAGEQHKTVTHAERVWRALAHRGMTRADHVVALGGGVVGDLAGFCAATYQRGVPVVQVPTTLVAQVDSAYGGKTGVDLPEAKNYVGAYHQPAGVLADTDTLATLDPAERAAGFAEVVKTALIAGGELWQSVRAGASADADVILGCARTKLAIVAADERDAGPRQALNLGHTFGHAIETATGYGRYRHGEAVGLGLLAALRVSGANGLRTEVRELLASQGLPLRLDGATPDTVLDVTERDKKRLGNRVPYVLIEKPGAVRTGCEVARADALAALRELEEGK